MTTRALAPERARRKQYLVSLAAGLFLLFLVSFDQGQLLSVVQGQLAYAQNFIHEAVHDSRHLNGMPCH